MADTQLLTVHFNWLTNPMVQSPWEVNSFSASHKVPCILWKSKVHWHVYKIPPTVPGIHSFSCSFIILYFLSIHTRLTNLQDIEFFMIQIQYKEKIIILYTHFIMNHEFSTKKYTYIKYDLIYNGKNKICKFV